ncbi:MAG: hypothetical protein LQ338_006139 [Usnochroma carphineum]|nr:MAG: hypothetical protein LQ338_006139 [Usnochroma carphineum]
MPQDDDNKPQRTKALPRHTRSPWLTTPKPIKRLFDTFPLITYPANDLPQRKPIDRSQNTLYIFARGDDAQHNAPSFNPSCLKWQVGNNLHSQFPHNLAADLAIQTYLKLLNFDFITTPSTNHASPTGSLPFLTPALSTFNSDATPLSPPAPIPSYKLQEWATKSLFNSSQTKESFDMRYEPYLSLLEHELRNAWLHTLYLQHANFSTVARPLYISRTTTSSLVRFSLSHHLRTAALSEILKTSSSPMVDIDALYRASDEAFSALSVLLGDNEWFFGEEEAGLMDASVFAYTHLLLDKAMGWEEVERMGQGLREGRWKNLAEHRRRIFEKCYQ